MIGVRVGRVLLVLCLAALVVGVLPGTGCVGKRHKSNKHVTVADPLVPPPPAPPPGTAPPPQKKHHSHRASVDKTGTQPKQADATQQPPADGTQPNGTPSQQPPDDGTQPNGTPQQPPGDNPAPK